MTVAELIEKLSQFPQELNVRYIADGCYGTDINVYKQEEDDDYICICERYDD